jgi:putative FmdB family regulatory protein
MPAYEYMCEACGEFGATRPMAEFRDPQPCPGCGAPSPRAWLSAPAVSIVAANTRQAHTRNERSADAPRHSSEKSSGHGSACGCCHAKSSLPRSQSSSLKAFPGRRPWMISH